MTPLNATKRCASCKKNQDISVFIKYKRSKDRLHYYCNVCRKADQHKRYLKYKEDYKRKMKKWRSTPEGKLYLKMSYSKMRQLYPEKYSARRILNNAVSRGAIIKPQQCELCKKELKLAAHHPSYDNPLEVIWACYPCHTEIHKKTIKYIT